MLSAPRVWSMAKKQQRDKSVTKGDTVGRLGPEPFLEMQGRLPNTTQDLPPTITGFMHIFIRKDRRKVVSKMLSTEMRGEKIHLLIVSIIE